MFKLTLCLHTWCVIPYTDETPLVPGEYLYFIREVAEQEAIKRNQQYTLELAS